MSMSPAAVPDRGAGLLELYDEALPQVYGYLLARCGDAPLAEDLTSDCFLAAVAAIRKPEPPTLSVAWLIGVERRARTADARPGGRRWSAPLRNRAGRE